ncbi:MAG: glutathione S-transferase family protein [Gammaproteobacteria bacterium]|nr:MAG: glutathione S-transferase family protein [Gammaproteobacteria bacterium]
MGIELVSFNLCPFVQRSIITLLYKQVDYKITYIDISNPPYWFVDISPFSKVPLLRIDGAHVLFESAVINEYIDDITPNRMQPEDPLLRALNRAWIEVGSACLVDLFKLLSTKDEKIFKLKQDEMIDRLDQVEEVLDEKPFFNGPDLSLVDMAYAPLFMRLAILGKTSPLYSSTELPNVDAWSKALLALPAVQSSVIPDFEELFVKSIKNDNGYAASIYAT